MKKEKENQWGVAPLVGVEDAEARRGIRVGFIGVLVPEDPCCEDEAPGVAAARTASSSGA